MHWRASRQLSPARKNFCSECGSHKERYFRIETAAEIFDLTPEAIRSMIRRRELPFHKWNSRVRLAYSDLERQLVRHPSKQEVSLNEIAL